MNIIRKFTPFLVKACIAALIVGALICLTDGNPLKAFMHIRPQWIALAAVLYAVHIFANAWRWHLLLRARKIECSLMEAVSLTMQSFFFSLVIPGGAIGGDLVRVTFLTRRVPKGQKFDGAFTILMDRFTGMIGIFSLALVLLPFCLKSLDTASVFIRVLIYVLCFGSVAGLCAAVFVFGYHAIEQFSAVRFLRKIGDKLSRGFFSKVLDAVDDYKDNKKELIICILASIVFVNLVLGGCACCICKGLDPAWNSPFSALCAITIGNIAGLLPATPSGIGARDIVVKPILESSGMSGESALAVSLGITALILAFNLLGGFFFLFSKRRTSEEK